MQLLLQLPLRLVPDEWKTPEQCRASVEQLGWTLVYVPQALRTPDLCLVAVQQDGEALKHVPLALRTPELCLAAVQQDGEALEFVPVAHQTLEWRVSAQRMNRLLAGVWPDASAFLYRAEENVKDIVGKDISNLVLDYL